jgi:hypothetical protein
MARRGGIKFWTDSFQGESYSKALSEKDYFGILLFQALIIRANQLDSDGEFTETHAYFARLLRVTRPKVSQKLAEIHQTFDQVSVENGKDSAKISIANYSKFQETRGRKKVKKTPEKTPNSSGMKRGEDEKMKRGEDEKIIKEAKASSPVSEISDSRAPTKQAPKRGVLKLNGIADLMQELGREKYETWLELYPEKEWVDRELKKAWQWCEDQGKSKRTSRGWKQFLNRWLERGWDPHVNRKPSSGRSDHRSHNPTVIEELMKRRKQNESSNS